MGLILHLRSQQEAVKLLYGWNQVAGTEASNQTDIWEVVQEFYP